MLLGDKSAPTLAAATTVEKKDMSGKGRNYAAAALFRQ